MIWRFTLVGCALLLGACVHPAKKYASPSTAKTQAAVNSASAANTDAQSHNANARTLSDRIDAKDRVIEEWRQQHGSEGP